MLPTCIKEIDCEHTPFIIASKKRKYLEINLIRKVKDPYNKNLKKPQKKETLKWKYIPCSWIDKINIMKRSDLSKVIYISVQHTSKSLSHFLQKQKTLLKFHTETQRTPDGQSNLCKKNHVGGVTSSDIKILKSHSNNKNMILLQEQTWNERKPKTQI